MSLLNSSNKNNAYISYGILRKGRAVAGWMLLVGLMALGVNSVATAQTSVRLGLSESVTGDIVDHPYAALTGVFSRILKQQTNGEYQVKVFPDGQLGNIQSITNQVANGTIELAVGLSPGHLSSWTSVPEVLELAYAFPNRSVAYKVLNYGEFGQELADKVAKKSGVRILAYTPSAYRNFSNNVRPVHTASDMKGLKIRVQQFPVYIVLVEALGASATPIAWTELYSALQTGVVDGQENAPYTMLLTDLQEVQKYYVLDHHVLNISMTVINEDFYQSLSEEEQRAFRVAAKLSALAFSGIVYATEGRALQTIRDAGVEIYSPTPEERETFKQATRKSMVEWAEKNIEGNWAERMFKAIDEAQAYEES